MSITKEYINNLLIAINSNYDDKLKNLRKDYDEKISELKAGISKLEMEILLLKNSNGNEKVKRELKDDVKCDPDIIRKHLDINSITSDFELFKILFIDNKEKSDYPIIYEKRSFKYWLNNEWNSDKGCEYIMKTITDIIRRLYFSVNKFDDYKGNLEKFIKNQTHIDKMKEKKYISSFIDKLKKLL